MINRPYIRRPSSPPRPLISCTPEIKLNSASFVVHNSLPGRGRERQIGLASACGSRLPAATHLATRANKRFGDVSWLGRWGRKIVEESRRAHLPRARLQHIVTWHVNNEGSQATMLLSTTTKSTGDALLSTIWAKVRRPAVEDTDCLCRKRLLCSIGCRWSRCTVQWRPLPCGVLAVSTAKTPTPAFHACLNSFWLASLESRPWQRCEAICEALIRSIALIPRQSCSDGLLGGQRRYLAEYEACWYVGVGAGADAHKACPSCTPAVTVAALPSNSYSAAR